MIFPNLPVRDLGRAMKFWSRLGFEYDKRFTDDKAACMTINEQARVMLLAEPFFQTFTKRTLCDTRTHVESLIALSCVSRAEVDELIARAVAAGGAEARAAQDHGFMYARSFYDLDGHQWEVLWMDPKALG
jgi:predicted lactoylglutathione lyase